MSINLTGRIDMRRTWWGGRRPYVEVRGDYWEDQDFYWVPMTEAHVIQLNTQVDDLRDEVKELVNQNLQYRLAKKPSGTPAFTASQESYLSKMIVRTIAQQKLPGGCLSELSPIALTGSDHEHTLHAQRQSYGMDL